jgi:hypothetical protein
MFHWFCRNITSISGLLTSDIYVSKEMRWGEMDMFLAECGQGMIAHQNVVLETFRPEQQTMRITSDAQRAPVTVLHQYAQGRIDERALMMAMIHKITSLLSGIDSSLVSMIDNIFVVARPTSDEHTQPELAVLRPILKNISPNDCPILIYLFNSLCLYTSGAMVMYVSAVFAMVAWFRELSFRHNYTLVGWKVRTLVDEIFSNEDLVPMKNGLAHKISTHFLASFAKHGTLYYDYDPFLTNVKAKGAGTLPMPNMIHDRPPRPPPPIIIPEVRTALDTLEQQLRLLEQE